MRIWSKEGRQEQSEFELKKLKKKDSGREMREKG